MSALAKLAGLEPDPTPTTPFLSEDEAAVLAAWGQEGIRAEFIVKTAVYIVSKTLAEIEGRAPRRAAARKQMQAVAASCEHLAALLSDRSVQVVLGAVGAGPALHAAGTTIEALSNNVLAVAEAAKAALAKLPPRRGRGRVHLAFGLPSARLLCAFVAIRLVQHSTGRRPGPSNDRARNLCVALWNAAGGDVSSAVRAGDVADFASWERQLKDALGRGGADSAALQWARGATKSLFNVPDFVERLVKT
jgi:hypothetical protein